MTVLSGRASPGARSVLRALLGGACAILGLIAGGCGNSTLSYGTPVISFSTTPGPFTAYIVELDQISLTRSDKTVVYPLITPEVVDFTKLTDVTELFGAPAVVEGTYVSATLTVNYTSAQIYANVNGTSQALAVLDAKTGATAGSIAYTVKFDPAHPLVIKKGISTPLDFNFDLSASSTLNTATSPMQLSVRPVMTGSTEPVYTKPVRARGVFVTTDTTNSAFTMNARGFFDTRSNPVGAVQVMTDGNTTYNVNGTSYKGSAGLAALKGLQINTIIEAYGSLGSLNAVKPDFTATEVYAGISVENLLADRVTGTVSARSGNTIHIHGAEVEARAASATGVLVTFRDDLAVTLADTTLVGVDRHPELGNPSIAAISVGQQVDIEGTATADSTGALNGVDASSGLVRLVSTSAWGVLTAGGQPASATVNLISLGGYQPAALTFTGTGSAAGAYAVSSSVDLSAVAANTLVRFDGTVTPFGAAPPDFTATAATKGSDAEQVLVVDWVNSGTAAPFTTATSAGLVVDMSNANLGTLHTVQSGPLYIQTSANSVDLTNPRVNPTIVADPARTSQFAIGNPSSSTALSVFHSLASYLTQINTVLNGTNTIQKLVAVGTYDQPTNTFTAYRIDLVQLP